MKKIKILFFIHQLNSGGAQKVILNLVTHLSKEKFDIVLVAINNIGEFSSFSHPDVKLIDLKSSNIRYSIFKIIKTIKKEKPDIVFSGLAYLSLIFSLLIPFLKIGNKIKFIARESSIVSISNAGQKYPKILDFMYKKFYRRFDLIVCQSEYMQNDLITNYNMEKSKMLVINNPVDIEYINKQLDDADSIELYKKDMINLLAIGRLHRVKGFDMLLKSVALLEDNYHLTILGDGKELGLLQDLASSLNILHRVHFLGFKSNPYIYMNQADLFVLSSRHEGFPNVILEANSCGIPVVAFNCPGGTGEIVIDKVNGLLVKYKDIEDMKDKIIFAKKNSWNKVKITELIKLKYSVTNIIERYEEVLK